MCKLREVCTNLDLLSYVLFFLLLHVIRRNPDSQTFLAYSVQTELKQHITLLAKFISPRKLF